MKDAELKKIVNEWCYEQLVRAIGNSDVPDECRMQENKFKLMVGVVADGILSRNNREKKD